MRMQWNCWKCIDLEKLIHQRRNVPKLSDALKRFALKTPHNDALLTVWIEIKERKTIETVFFTICDQSTEISERL